jgi:hypothetical protein
VKVPRRSQGAFQRFTWAGSEWTNRRIGSSRMFSRLGLWD